MRSETEYLDLYGRLKDVPLPVSRETGALLYMLARSSGARTIVEFGTSFGISTLHLAAALPLGGRMAKALASKTIVWIELIADVLVAAIRLAAALFTGSASMAAEGVHSIVDIGSGGLMLYGYRQSQRGPDRRHPLGHGRELYFWSFVVALLFFTLGAGFSIFEGVEG